MNAATDAARAEAERRVDDPDAGTAPAPPAHTLALAWALKDLCYAAWSSQPARAARAAQVLGQLSTQGLAPAQACQVQGLAAWTAGIACLTQGQMAQAVLAFDQAQAALLQADQPDAAAQTQVPKVMALAMLGQHEEATACGEAAQRTLLALGNASAAGRVSLNLGSLLLRRDAYAQSVPHFRQAAVLFARLGDHLHSVLGDIGLAGALTSLGDFDEALRIYARARMRASNQGLEQPLAIVDEAVALLDLARGRFREALAGFHSARQRFQALALPHALAIAERHLADAYLDLRLLPEALALLDTASAQFAQLELPDEQAWALAQRGRTQALLGRTDAAQASFAEAAALFAEQDQAVGLASVVLAQAELALAQGDTAAAQAWADDAATRFGTAGQADGQARAQVIGAQALWQGGQAAAALEVWTRTLDTARQRQQLQVQVRCLTGQGLVAQAQGHTARAGAAFEAAIELLEDQRRALPGDELRSAFLTDHLRPYQERLRQALQADDAWDTLAQLERYRARSLSERLDEGAAGADTPSDEDAELRGRLNWLVRRLQDGAEHSAPLQDELLHTERELLERARRRRLAAPGAAGAAAAHFDGRALQAALGSGDALVEYGVLDDELFALVLTAGGLHLQRHLAPWGQTAQVLQSTRFQIDTLRHGLAPVQGHLAAISARTQARLQQLHGLLWAPLQPWLAGVRRVLVVPHGALAATPFAALHGGGEPLAAHLQLALVPSARAALRGLRRQPVAARTALALGDASRLPHAGAEAQRVASLFAQGQALVGAAATLSALQQQAGQADVLHLACHAQFRSDNPRFSALHLHDAALTAEAAERLPLRAGTVVLSACESGLADATGGDEMVGLVRAFLVAGAARVLATLWPVDDAVTADFMAGFYGALAAGSAPSLALQQAQTRLRERHPQAHFWAPFTLFGGW